MPKLSFLRADDQTSWWQTGLSQTRCSSQKMLSKGQISGRKEMVVITLGSPTRAKLSSTYRQSRHCYKKLCSKLASSIPLSHRLYNKCKKWFKRTVLASLRHILLNHSNKDQLYQTVSFSPASCLSASVNIRLHLKSGFCILQLLTMRQARDGSYTRHRLTGDWGAVWEKGVPKVLGSLLPHC